MNVALNSQEPNTQGETNLVMYIEALQSIDTDSALAIVNATSIDDNNGGRIEL